MTIRGRRTAGPSTRILLLGKRGSLVMWLENLYHSCVRLHHPTQVFAINGNTPLLGLWAKWRERASTDSGWMLRRFERVLTRFRPELVLVAGVFGVPLDYYRLLYAQNRRPVIAGLVGDRFSVTDSRERADHCDRLYYTDTRFFRDAEVAGFTTGGRYLPLAADPELFRPARVRVTRQPELLFVASRTTFRETVVRSLESPARIVGTDWSDLAREDFHRVRNRKIGRARLIRLYQHHVAVLNARNEANVEHGLNQRSFEPPACGAVVLNDDLADLPRCFEPGREILVYRDAEELNALVARLWREPEFAERVATAGRRRVLAEHTYEHRMATILNDLGL